jgi:hypothetical protein
VTTAGYTWARRRQRPTPDRLLGSSAPEYIASSQSPHITRAQGRDVEPYTPGVRGGHAATIAYAITAGQLEASDQGRHDADGIDDLTHAETMIRTFGLPGIPVFEGRHRLPLVPSPVSTICPRTACHGAIRGITRGPDASRKTAYGRRK